jgi:hypothetical protein
VALRGWENAEGAETSEGADNVFVGRFAGRETDGRRGARVKL